MTSKRSRSAPPFAHALETLEGRMVLSGMGSAAALPHGAVEVAAQSVKNVATTMTLKVSSGTLGQPIAITATVRAAGGGSPVGTVNLIDHGQVIQTLNLSPASSSTARSGISSATLTFTPQPGGAATFLGKHTISAEFVPSGPFSKSVATKNFTVAPPTYTTLPGGVKVATIAPGSGPAIGTGQTANVLYTGYLATTGHIFDDSQNDGGKPLSFTLGAGEVVPGFDAGTLGMRVGESRLISIPPGQGYGATANGPIPANSTLLFEVTLQSIS